jgi:hypothetical protein
MTAVLFACGGEKKEETSAEGLVAPESLPGIGEEAERPGIAQQPTPAPTESAGAGASQPQARVAMPTNVEAIIEVWPRIYLRSAEPARIGYRVDIANTGSSPTTVTFLGIETKNFIQADARQEKDNSMTIARDIQLEPGGNKRILGGDFPLQLGRALAAGEQLTAGISGMVKLKDPQGGTEFSIPFSQSIELSAENLSDGAR